MLDLLRLIYGADLLDIINEFALGIIIWKIFFIILIALAGNLTYYILLDRPSWANNLRYFIIYIIFYIIAYLFAIGTNEYYIYSVKKIESISDLIINIFTWFLRLKIWFNLFWLSFLIYTFFYALLSLILKKFTNNNRYIPQQTILFIMMIVPLVMIIFIYIIL